MSLRMNLYGWSLLDFKQVLRSKDSAVLEKATALIYETLPEEPDRSRAEAWLQALVINGFPFRKDCERPKNPADGELLVVQMETEAHAFALYCLVRAIARDEHLDLASESSCWTHLAIQSLYRESVACGFTKSEICGLPFFSTMAGLDSGTPLFGDDFRTDWSYYTAFSNGELTEMIPVFQAAADFRRSLPESYPESTRKMATGLSDDGRRFAQDLIRWFGQIQQAGQDAFILWW